MTTEVKKEKKVKPVAKQTVKPVEASTKKPKLKAGIQVKLLVGSSESRGKLFTVKKVDGKEVFLDGYKLAKRTTKISQENQNNYKTVHHSVHVSNVTTKIESK